MSTLSSLNKTSDSRPTNRDGFTSWERPLDEQYLQTLMTNTFGATFYADKKQLVEESAEVHTRMLATDPMFASKALVYARNRGFMRSQPVYGLARLSIVNPAAFARVFDEVIRTPNDLRDFLVLIKASRRGEGGSAIKKAAGKWLVSRLNPYWAIKYGAESREGYSLADMIKVCHPKFGARNPLVSYLFGKETSELPAQVVSYEALKRATTDEEKIRHITEGKLPVEVASTFAGSSKNIWAAIVPQMPIFALTRHLATLERHGIMDSVRDVVVAKLTSAVAVQNSKMFPYRFLEAAKHVTDTRVSAALHTAVDLAFDNIPTFEGRTATLLDISGSMASFLQQAALFAYCTMKKSRGNGRLIEFDTKANDRTFSMEKTVLSQANAVRVRGGTNCSAPMQLLLDSKDRVDNVIMITDEQQNSGAPFLQVFEQYRNQVNRAAKLFVLDVSPYRNALTPTMRDVYYLYGWTDSVLQFVSMASRGWGSQVDAIRSGQAMSVPDTEQAD